MLSSDVQKGCLVLTVGKIGTLAHNYNVKDLKLENAARKDLFDSTNGTILQHGWHYCTLFHKH